jgi:predicted ATP-dependent serine protease
LTGRLRQAAQAERRLEECAKLGITTVITPAQTDTLTKAVDAALAQSVAAQAP